MDVTENRPGKLVVVTGASSRFGRAICKGLSETGWSVVAIGRDLEALQEISNGSSQIHIRKLDVTDPLECKKVFREVGENLGEIDALIACATIYPKIHFLDQDPECFQNTILTNICGVANSIREVLPGMLERNLGRVIVMGSLADITPIATAVSYSCSKGGMHALVKGIATEIDRARAPNVLINELIPDPTRDAEISEAQELNEVVQFVSAQLAFPSNGPTGRCWMGNKEVRLGESWKRALLRTVLRRS